MPEKASSFFVNQLEKIYYQSKALIIHGNIKDVICYKSQYFRMEEFLNKFFTDKGYQMIGHYDLLDGLYFKNRKHRDKYYELYESSDTAKKKENGEEYKGAPSQKNAAATESADLHKSDKNVYKTGDISMLETLRKIRSVMDHDQCPPTVFIIYFPEYLVEVGYIKMDQKQALILLSKLIAIIYPVNDLPKLVVFVADNIGNIPLSLYKENPFCKQIYLTLPDKGERQGFIEVFYKTFYGAVDKNKADNIDNLAVATDGLNFYDIDILRTISHKEKIDIHDEKALIKSFKFNSRKTPWDDLSKKHINNMQDVLQERVKGQNDAIKAIEIIIKKAKVGTPSLKNTDVSTKPKGIFLFCGPTGVGKTSLAKALTYWLFKDENAMIRFDMSEYSKEHSDQKLTGAPPGYIGYGEGGQLTKAVKKKPFSVILFDEVDKMDSKIWDIFLQIFDDGRLTDSSGQTVYFSETIIILTSNIGGSTQPAGDDIDEIRKHYINAVKSFFRNSKNDGGIGRPEILNRIGPDNIIVFNPIISKAVQEEIVKERLFDLKKWCKKRENSFELDFDDSVIKILMAEEEGFPRNGARGVENLIETHIIGQLAEFLCDHTDDEIIGKKIHVSLQKDGNKIVSVIK
ncbi:MAG TPA: AAA family ATPase [Bacteroidales bacterium]|jgi:flagellar biosynthesis GTPase FlhF|nr:AAA family ATPase [Bacteroidales bacterium]HPM10668.1 AAA family ATPase [Paludibacter sp.]